MMRQTVMMNECTTTVRVTMCISCKAKLEAIYGCGKLETNSLQNRVHKVKETNLPPFHTNTFPRTHGIFPEKLSQVNMLSLNPICSGGLKTP